MAKKINQKKDRFQKRIHQMENQFRERIYCHGARKKIGAFMPPEEEIQLPEEFKKEQEMLKSQGIMAIEIV